jgi:hypothetical protein
MDELDADIRPERRNSPPRCECGVQFGEYRHGGCMGAGHLDAIVAVRQGAGIEFNDENGGGPGGDYGDHI